MRGLALVLLLLLLPVGASAQTVLYFNGLETGDTGEFTAVTTMSVGTNCQLIAPPSGAYCLQVGAASAESVSPHSLGGTTLYGRMRFLRHAESGDNYIFTTGNSGKWIGLVMRHSDGKIGFSHNNTTIITAGSTVLSVDTWYLLEWKAVIDGSVGGLEVKLNGSVEFSSFSTNTSDISTFDYVSWGPAAITFTGTFGYDDLMVCSGAYCPSGRTIARQGASGTPTYNAWTKNSCTGGTIDGCWSDTPTSTVSNASTSTASAAQTMIVHDYATTQSGHGTETIGAASTINACKTIIRAKSGTASAPLSIRRRVNGTDTDTAITLTTSDATYYDSVWTTTTAILRDGSLLEIGAVHGTGSATDTVEDVWISCDYLDSASPVRHKVNQQ